MDEIDASGIRGFLANSSRIRNLRSSRVRADAGHHVRTYLELAKKIAELQFENPQYVLLFRGQDKDYLNRKKHSMLKPSLFRHQTAHNGDPPSTDVLAARFDKLRNAESALMREFEAKAYRGEQRVNRHRLIRWAILQHYEICPTPLLDVSQSLRRLRLLHQMARNRPDTFLC